MDLLESVLRASEAQNYIENFRNARIDHTVLKLLDEDDLQKLGVEDPAIRKSIMQHAANLQVHCEKKIDLTIDKEYIQLVLYQINRHLNLHYANLSCPLTRTDITLCDVMVSPAAICLEHCIDSFEKQLDKFEEALCLPTEPKRIQIPSFLILAVPAVGFGFLALKFCMQRLLRK